MCKALSIDFIERLIERECTSRAKAWGSSGCYHYCPLSNPLAGTGQGGLTTLLQPGTNNGPVCVCVRVCMCVYVNFLLFNGLKESTAIRAPQ